MKKTRSTRISLRKIEKDSKQVPQFAEILNSFLKDVNTMQSHADHSIEKMVSREKTDVHQVVGAVQEAGIAYKLMMEMRKKMMKAYREILRM
jgi:flagellar hook-basal body complex protein FliE